MTIRLITSMAVILVLLPASGATHAVQLDPAIAAVRARDLGTRASGDRTELTALASLKAGDNVIELLGGPYALDIDYLEIAESQ